VEPDSVLGIEGAAREARYSELQKYADEVGADCVLLGHTENDQAESVLLGLLRGSGAKSLRGMKVQRGIFYRPFLEGITRQDTEAICGNEKLNFWVDPEEGKRGLVRRELLPNFEKIVGKSVISNLALTAKLLNEDDEALDQIADKLYNYLFQSSKMKVSALKGQPSALRKRIYRLILVSAKTANQDVTSKHLYAIDNLVTDWHGQKPLSVPNFRVFRSEGYLYFEKLN
jgi:tRNA(Ile)-lysidine synthase